MRLLLVLIGLLILIPEADAARWRWPWEAQRVRQRQHQHHRHRARTEKVLAPIDCKQINEAVNSLSPERLAKAIARSNAKQRKTITDCTEKGSSK